MTIVSVTTWEGVRTPGGKRLTIDWKDLPDLLESFSAAPGMLWAPTEYRDNYHSAEAYERSTAIVLDHDAATVPFEALPELLAGTQAIVHETKTKGRWRAVLALRAPLAASAYEKTVEPIARALDCARESWSPYHMWFPPRGPVTVIDGSPVAGGTRLDAWIAGDYDNPLVANDLPRKGDGTPDRSVIDMMLVHAMLAEGSTDAAIADTIRNRGELSHRTDDRYIEITIAKARKRQEQQSLWANKDMVSGAEGKTVIRVGPDLDRVADECALAIASRPDVYARGESLVSVQGTEAHLLSSVRIADELSKAAFFVKATKDGDRPCEPPERVCRILADRKSHRARPLRIIAPFPLVRLDGSVCYQPGYDPATESLYVGAPLDAYDMSPQEALKALREPFAEFPFEREGMIDVIVALVLTIVCRQTIAGNVPLFALDASQKGAGKSLLATSVSLLALGEHVAFASWPDDANELDKRLSAIALSAAPYASFDEAQVVGGGALNSLLTGNGRHSFRRLGKTERVIADWYTVLSVAANNIAIKGDTRRRTLECRLTPGVRRRVHTLDLPTWIPENRARLLGAAISLVRPQIGRTTGPVWPSFEQWARTIAGAIITAGGHDVTQFRTADDEETDAQTREAITTWIALRWPDGATARAIADDLGGEMGMVSAAAQEVFRAVPEIEGPVKEAMRTIAQNAKGKAQALGMALRNWRQVRTREGLYLDRNNATPPVWHVSQEDSE